MSHTPGLIRHKEYYNGQLLEVRDNGDHRSLYFGSEQLQSRMSLSRPQALVLSYTWYMAASLLIQTEPQDILIIGIGAGSFVRFFSRHFPKCRIDAVDHSPHIVAVARGYFGLPENDRVTVYCRDGLDFLQESGTKHYDLILIDAFDDKGMAPTIYSAPFFKLCAAGLNNGGVVSCNLWSSDALHYQEIKKILGEYFAAILYCPVPERGNIVALAMQQAVPWSKIALKKKEYAKLSDRFGINFKELAATVKATNLSLSQQFLTFLGGGRK